jgi:6-phosphogluconolactonase
VKSHPPGGRRRLATAIAAACCLTGCSPAALDEPPRLAASDGPSADRFLYVGTYTGPDVPPDGRTPSTARGIYVFRMRASDGHLTLVRVTETDNPSYLALDPTLTHLYCTNQNDLVDGVPGGRVSAYAVSGTDGTLAFLNTQPTHGTHPAHLSVHRSGAYLLASNYGGGDYPVYRILADGSIGPETDDAHGNGAGRDPDRQEAPHAHQILTDPESRRVFGVDLGADEILIWNLDLATGKLTSNAPAVAAVAGGSGPRHMVFHPTRRFAYVVNELAGSITTFLYNPLSGALLPQGTVSTLPTRFTGAKSAAEIRIHPSGRFLYSTNRGHNSVAMFAIDEKTGALDPLGWEPTRGEWPRGMNLDPSGKFLYVANQNSDTIVVFRVDPLTGKLVPTGETIHTPTPVDIEFGGMVPAARAAR